MLAAAPIDMAPPRARPSAVDPDASMSDAPAPSANKPDEMVSSQSRWHSTQANSIMRQEVDETPDFTDSDTNPNTTASSIAGDHPVDGRRKRAEANQLRRSIFGRKHDALGESKVCLGRKGYKAAE